MRAAKIFSFWSVAFSALLIFLYVFWTSIAGQNSHLPESYRADQLFQEGEYAEAMRLYEAALARHPVFTGRFPQLQFKMAFCQYQIKRFPEARAAFSKLKNSLPLLADYAQFFAIKAELAMGDSTTGIRQLSRFKRRFPDSPVLPFVDSLEYGIYFHHSRWDSAASALRRMIASGLFDRSELFYRLFKMEVKSKADQKIRSLGFKILRLYPTLSQSQEVFRTLQKKIGDDLSASGFRKMFTFLEQSGRFSAAGKFLTEFVKKNGPSELSDWLAIQLEYARGNYAKALEECLSRRKRFTSRKYLMNIDLHIARCYLKLGNVEQSIKAYSRFQKRYPRAKIADEVLWKIAWLYEEKEETAQARRVYTRLLNQYPRSQFAPEARFRIGLSFYRAGDYLDARNLWANFMEMEPDSSRKSRYQYWIAKTFLQKKEYGAYLNILEKLGANPFDGYYNLKAHLLVRDGETSNTRADSILWEMHHQTVSYLPGYLPEYRRFILVREILGRKFARSELANRNRERNDDDWKSQFALAELQERLRNYGQAFRIFRSIFDAHFIDRNWDEWVFLFKRLYPLYFDSLVVRNAQTRKIPPSFLWAIIKKESAFEPKIVSYANAYGLMQIIPKTARQISRRLALRLDSVEDLYRADFNIKLGAWYIADLLKKYEGNMYYALAAYNAGPHRVDRWRRIYTTEDDDLFMENIEFQQTRVYVRTVMRYYWTYYLLLHPQQVPENILAFPQHLSSQNGNPRDDVVN